MFSILAGLATTLIREGVEDLGKSLLTESKEVIVDKVKDVTGLDLKNKEELTQDDVEKLRQFEVDNKEFILKELELRLKDTQDARDMYENTDHTLADNVANNIFKYNLWILVFLILLNVVAVKYLDDVELAIVSNFIGIAIKTLFDERSTVINFLFGSSITNDGKGKQ